MAERVSVRRRTGGQHDLRGDQPSQLNGQGFRRLSGYRVQQPGPELPSNYRSNLRKLLGIGAEPVEARQQRRLQRLGNFALAKGAPAIQNGFGQLLDKERHAAGALADARDDVLREGGTPGSANHLDPLTAAQTA